MRLSIRLFALLATFAATPGVALGQPAYILIDADSGTVLADRDSDHLWQPASVTKLMTAYLVFESLKSGKLTPTSPVKISANALAQAPSKMGFKVGTVLNVDNALKMMLVHSANDIAMALAETVGGSENGFVAMMNQEAATLGMASTHFQNPNGLPDSTHLSTARDLAVLARALWTNFPEYRPLLTIPAIVAGKRVLRSNNLLLERYHGTNGMKTGFVCSSGFNLVASASRFGRTMIVVVLGAQSWTKVGETAASLLNQGFGNWFPANRPQLASFESGPASGAAADLRDQICGKHVKHEDDADATSGGDTSTSALEPRFQLMPPVPVYTGRTGSDDAAASEVASAPAKSTKKSVAKTVTAGTSVAKASVAGSVASASDPPAAAVAPPVKSKLAVPVPKPRPVQ